MKRFVLLFLFAFPFSAFTAHAAAGDSIWSVNFIHDIQLNFSQTSYWDSLINTHATDSYMRCDMLFDGHALPSIGAKLKGNSSFNGPGDKKSFKLDLNEYVSGQDYDGIKKLNLNNSFKDPTLMREKIALDFMRAHGIAAPRCTYARVYLNGVYWGLYTLVEEIDSKFLKQHYPDNDGNLFKGDPSGDLKWYGAAQSSYYSHYELQTNETTNDWSDLVHLIDLANNTASAGYYDSLETVIDSWGFLNYMAATNLFVNLDSYIGSGHNYFLYDDSTYFRFHWIAWDVNESFGNFSLNMNVSQLENLNYDYLSQSASKPLASKMLADPTYHSMYISAFCNLMPYFTNTVMDPYIDSLANKIRADVYADTLKFYSNQQFEDNITSNVGNTAGLKPFIAARYSSLSTQLQTYGCWLGTAEVSANTTSFSAFPNPATDLAELSVPSGTSASQLKVLDVNGKEVQDISLSVSSDVKWTLSTAALANGVYFLVLENGTKPPSVSKLVVLH